MGKNHLHKILSRIADVKPGEGTISALLFCYFFLITAPYYIIKPLRNAFYLHTMGAKKLPQAYLLTAILMGFVVAFHSKIQEKISRQLLITYSLLFFILTSFLFWLFFPYEWSWLAIAFYLWVNIFIIVLVTQFWIIVNDIFNPREAKRLIGFFGSGGILGGLVGGELTGFLAKSKVDYHLLLLATGMLIACVFVAGYIFMWQKKRIAPAIDADEKKKRKEPDKVGFKECFNTIKNNYYLKLLAAVVVITIIIETLIDFQFNSVVEETGALSNNLTAFYGHFFGGLLVFSFFLQLLLTSNIIRRYGILFALLLYPLTLLFCSLGIAIFVNIYFAILLRGSDKSLYYSLNQSVRELIYIPISPEIKYKAKVFIDMFLNRFSKSIGAVILIILGLYHLGIQYISIVTALFILSLIFFNLKISKEYINNVKQKLKIKWRPAEKIVAEKIDVDYAKLVFDTLESKNRSSVLYAMHLFDLIKKDKLTPELKKLISYKSDEVRMSSLGNLFEDGETTLFPEMEDRISNKALEKEIKETMSLDVYQEVMNKYIDNVLMNKGKDAEIAKMEVAKAIGLMNPDSPLAQKLEVLLQDGSPEVVRYAIESAGKLKKREYVPLIIRHLVKSQNQEAARNTLVEYGMKIIGTLKDYLEDAEQDIKLRKSIPDILARMNTQEAANLLALELDKKDRDVEPEIIEALYKMKLQNPLLRFQEKIIISKIILKIKECYLMLMEMNDLAEDSKKVKTAKEKEINLTQPLKHIFELLSLIYPQEDVIKAYQNICAGTEKAIDYSVELLDNLLNKEIKMLLIPLIDNITLDDRIKKCKKLLKALKEA
jgi:AAA family ATP:ADP antiporter